MHSASWPSIRAQCVHVGRIRIKSTLKTPIQCRAFSGTSQAQFGAALSFFRSTHSFVDTSSSPGSRDFPINVIETQQSIRTLSALLEEGNLDKARQVLADILDRIPADGEVDVYRQVKHVIAPKDVENPAIVLIMQLGLAAASRGYSHFTREEVLPLLDQSGTAELHSQIERELEIAELAQRTTPINGVFEDTSDDYAVISSQPTAVQPSAMDHIVAQLPALLPEPVVADTSIFEDAETELLDGTPALPSEHINNTSVGLLDRTLLAGRYEDAYKLLNVMKELGAYIPPDPKYAYVAISIIKANEHLARYQVDRVVAWLNLIPMVHRTTRESWLQVTTVLSKLEQQLLQDATVDLHTATRMIILLASKGYIDRLQRLVVIVVSSIGELPLMPWIEQVENAFTDYTVDEGQPMSKLFRAKSIFRNRVIKSLVFAHRADEAIPLLLFDGTWAIHKVTTKILLTEASYRQPGTPLPMAMEFAGKEVHPEELVQYKTEDPIDFGEDLALGAKYLKEMLATRSRVPHPFTIVNFMTLYLATGRTRIIRTLFDRAHRSIILNSKSYILAEMLFYHRHHLPHLVIQTFVEHFYLFGVDKKMLLKHYEKGKERRKSNPRLSVRFHYSEANPYTGRKLFPENDARILVWDALLRTAPGHDLKLVYLAFLEQATVHKAVLEGNRLDKRMNIGVYSVKSRFTSSSFTPFIDRMMRRYGEKAGHRIMRDILDLGIAPHIYIYTELAKYYSRANDEQRVFEIVYRLEEAEHFQYKPPTQDEPFLVLLPAPDLPFYVAILRGFVMNRNVRAADRVVDHIARVFYDARQTYPFYKAALEDLEGLKTHGDAWMPQPYASDNMNAQIEKEIATELRE